MSVHQRLTRLIEDASALLGSQAALARYLGVTRAAITEYKTGRSMVPGDKVLRLQDLLKRAACVVIALGATVGGTPDTYAIDRTQIVGAFVRQVPETNTHWIVSLLQKLMKLLNAVRQRYASRRQTFNLNRYAGAGLSV